jgi:putative N6-adenine-specific DNA methylase
MPSESSLSKRIKRHVIGRSRSYFAATPPGFETICLNELLLLPLTVNTAAAVVGGVEFKGRLKDCHLANLYLRTANRILLRIDTFKAANFSRLKKRAAGLPWELYLRPGDLPAIHATTSHCRLYHTKAVRECFLASIAEHMAKTVAEKDYSRGGQQIFIRGVDDRFMVSIDSSGKNLYKRGLKKYAGKAPIRENIAAAALLLVGYTGREPLVDPMCGSGTFSLEGALIAKNIPPGWFREFAFMTWPSFRPSQWAYLKRQAETQFVGLKKPLIFASDKDPAACRQLHTWATRSELTDAIEVFNKDFFELDPRNLARNPGVVAINPPYGRRIGTPAESRKLLRAVCDRLKAMYKGWSVILIAPGEKPADKVPFPSRTYPLFHGGLKLTLTIGRIG